MSALSIPCVALLPALSAGLAACGTRPAAAPPPGPGIAEAMATVEGRATPAEPAAMPEAAVFEATLEDVSRADAPATVVGTVRVENPRWPVRFVIPYEPSDIAAERSYAVRARVVAGGRLWFTSDRIHRVLTRGAGRSVEIPMQRVDLAPPGR